MLNRNVQTHATLASVIPFPFPQERSQPKTFHHTIGIFLKDSNAYGNTYFARYFEWQGICREHWFQQHICPDMLQTQGVLITKCAHQDYAQETLPFQKVECRLNTYNIKQCSFNLLFRFYVGGKLVSRGYQQIVFADHNKKITRFPQKVLDGVREYEDPEFSLQG